MNSVSPFRHLFASEIAVLEADGCEASDWGNVLVHSDFVPGHIRHTRFEGTVRIGRLDGKRDFAEDAFVTAGIYNAGLCNVTVGDNCLIQNAALIRNYEIEDGVTIRNADRIVCSLDSTFGNNIPVPVLIETGGREVMIYDNLTSQEAYLMSLHRYRTDVLKYLLSRIEIYGDALCGLPGRIGRNARLENVRELRNVRVGAFAVITGVCRLECGTVLSSEGEATVITDGVIARNFIIKEGARVFGHALLTDCFVGKACHIGQGFSAVNSLFFANCHFENGEACSLFAGPFSVSHHKSTLLIACQTSFFNAGSGSNQSNHSYKLGPNKYGILERGVKLASGSYLYWPARVGAFSTVLGHHTLHADFSTFPFSYLVEERGKSVLVPGVALRSIGIMRDIDKWPERDGRAFYKTAVGKGLAAGEDLTTFSLFNPYIIARMQAGIDILKSLSVQPEKEISGTEAGLDSSKSYFIIGGAYVSSTSLRRAVVLYENAVLYYALGAVADRIAAGMPLQSSVEGEGLWCDYGGYIAPQAEVEKYWEELLNPSSSSDRLRPLLPFDRERIARWEWNWVARVVEKYWGVHPAVAGREKAEEWILLWKKSVEVLFADFLHDAEKEFAPALQFIYGSDGTEADRQTEFRMINGTCETHSFVRKLLHRKKQLLQLAENAEISLRDS